MIMIYCVSAPACAQVERWLEELHDRRRCLEVLFSNRRTILDQCRTLCQLYADLGTSCSGRQSVPPPGLLLASDVYVVIFTL